MNWAGRSSEAEFRYRFVAQLAVYLVAFGCGAFDRRLASAWRAQKLAGSLAAPPGAAEFRALLILAALLVIAAAALRTWAAAYLNSSMVHDGQLHAGQLVADGPYRRLRNPLHLGGLLLGIGFGARASPVGFLVLVGGLAAFYSRLIARDETALASRHGVAFDAYCQTVPAF